jgi:Lar family restriction alleviation protein
MTDHLSPCPFCGSAAERIELTDGDNAGGSVIGCTKCEASTRVFFGEKDGLTEAWNDRPKGLRAGLRDALDTAICCLTLPGCSVALEMVLFGNQTDAIVDAALSTITPRITELIEANNRMEAEARAARADAANQRAIVETLDDVLHSIADALGCEDDNEVILQAIDAKLTSAKAQSRRVRHIKRGSTYRVIGEAEAQVSTGELGLVQDLHKSRDYIYREIHDGSRLTIYQCDTDGRLWARFTEEFEDGRFEEMPT